MRKNGINIVHNSICRVIMVVGIAAGLMVFCTDCGVQPELISLEEIDLSDNSDEINEDLEESAQSEQENHEESETNDASNASSGTVHVFVCGAVKNEGVYVLPEGTRVYEAVEQAGGFREDADTTFINQATLVEDGQKLEIPTLEEALKFRESGVTDTSTVGQTADNGKININTADAALLETIPGIGAVKAQRIIDYRNDNGLFESIEEITNVSGIGEASLRKIRDYITVGKINSG